MQVEAKMVHEMKHKRVELIKHIIAQTWKRNTTSSPIIYSMSSGKTYIKITENHGIPTRES
jgi:hypothetical protein